jgi:hypothetical protein
MDTFKAKHNKVVELVKKRAEPAALQKEVDDLLDYKALAETSLGGPARYASKCEPRCSEFETLLARLIRENYLKRIRTDKKYDLTYVGEETKPRGTHVITNVSLNRDGKPEVVEVVYVMHQVGGDLEGRGHHHRWCQPRQELQVRVQQDPEGQGHQRAHLAAREQADRARGQEVSRGPVLRPTDVGHRIQDRRDAPRRATAPRPRPAALCPPRQAALDLHATLGLLVPQPWDRLQLRRASRARESSAARSPSPPGTPAALPRLAYLPEPCPGTPGGCSSVCLGPPATCAPDACRPVLIDSGTAITLLARRPRASPSRSGPASSCARPISCSPPRPTPGCWPDAVSPLPLRALTPVVRVPRRSRPRRSSHNLGLARRHSAAPGRRRRRHRRQPAA